MSSAQDVAALARALASEASSHSEAERRGIAWTIRNMAAHRRKSIWEMGGAGEWGAQGEDGRPFSTARAARTADVELATQVLAEPVTADPVRGATSFFEPALQDDLARRGALYRSDPDAYPEHYRFRLYKSDAAGIRTRWTAGGQERKATIGRWEFWGRRGAGAVASSASDGGIGGAIAGLALLWLLG